MKLKSYQQALAYIYDKLPMYQRVGPSAYKKDLTNTLMLCTALGNPHNKLKCVHIAGTNGKGTTSHLIAGGLQAQGWKVGVYTSPHYKDFRERIKINGMYIRPSKVTAFLNKNYDIIEKIQPSFFEVTVALAFDYFVAEKVDYAVIETGLGGRLDSTNVIMPILSVITNISFDHQQLLGNTLGAIASEKAGIIKDHVPVLIGERQSSVQQVFIDKAADQHTLIHFAEDLTKLDYIQESGEGNTYGIQADDYFPAVELKTDISGPFQTQNVITAYSALKLLSKMMPIQVEKMVSFFTDLKARTGYVGRWQIIGKSPLIIADSAHNIGGLSIILSHIKNIKYDQLHIVMGFVNDKDINEILKLFPKEARYYFAKANIPRGLPAKELQEAALANGLSGRSYTSVKKALSAAKRCAKPADFIFIGGSIFIVAEVI